MIRWLFTCFFASCCLWATAQSIRCNISENAPVSTVNPRLSLRTETLTIPVIFHIMEERGDNDAITDEQVFSQIDVLNRLFNQESIDKSQVPQDYLDRILSPQIEFCLALENSNGDEIEPIKRYFGIDDNIADDVQTDGRRRVHYAELGGADPLEVKHYLNIWVANSNRFAARSSFPSDALDPFEDGIIIDPDFLGITDRAALNIPFHLGRTLAHEIGHYLGLSHIWGSGSGGDCSNDDGLADTPEQLGPNRGCPTSGFSSCSSADLISNLMDFSDDECLQVFTRDQVELMRANLSNLRSELNTSCNQSITSPLSAYVTADKLLRVDAECSGLISIYDFGGRIIHKEERSHSFGPSYIYHPRRAGIYVLELRCEQMRYIQKIVLE